MANTYDDETERQLDEMDRRFQEILPPEKLWRYIDSESGKEHVSTLEALIQFASVGTFLDGGQVKRPLSSQWEDPRNVPELKPGFDEWREATTFIVRIQGREYRAEGARELASWVTQGRVLPDTQVYNPHEKCWMAAREIKNIATVWKSQAKSGCLGTFLLLAR